MGLVHTFIVAFMAFFAIMNPSATLPVYLSLTSADDTSTARAIGLRGCIIAFVIVAVFALLGKALFELFGISLPALRIAGGSLVFLIGFQMVQGSPSNVQQPNSSDQQAAKSARLSVAVSPLAMPMMAGPGSIATAMNLAARENISHAVVTIAAYGLLCFLTFLIFLGGKPLVRFLGQNMMNVITRLMGLILAVIGVQMMIQGLNGAFPVLAGIH